MIKNSLLNISLALILGLAISFITDLKTGIIVMNIAYFSWEIKDKIDELKK